jgi:RimJ/RimL family protein N-acetyltransferase
MELRRAVESDADDVLLWRNDPGTVAMCATQAAVAPDDHYRWFAAVLRDPSRLLFIAHDGNRKIGAIRFDRFDDAWVVNIMIAPEQRGRGHSAAMLRSAILRLGDLVGAVPLAASIRPENAASIRIFERCGFHRVWERNGLLRYERH